MLKIHPNLGGQKENASLRSTDFVRGRYKKKTSILGFRFSDSLVFTTGGGGGGESSGG